MYYAVPYLLVGVLLGLGLARLALGKDGWTASEGKYIVTFCAVAGLLWPLLLVAAWRPWRRQGEVSHDQE